jgi:hypothetical protein
MLFQGAHIFHDKEVSCRRRHKVSVTRWQNWPLPDGTNTSLLTYLLAPWSRVLLEKITGSQLVKKFPAFYGTRRFITAFTSARHLSLS